MLLMEQVLLVHQPLIGPHCPGITHSQVCSWDGRDMDIGCSSRVHVLQIRERVTLVGDMWLTSWSQADRSQEM